MNKTIGKSFEIPKGILLHMGNNLIPGVNVFRSRREYSV